MGPASLSPIMTAKEKSPVLGENINRSFSSCIMRPIAGVSRPFYAVGGAPRQPASPKASEISRLGAFVYFYNRVSMDYRCIVFHSIDRGGRFLAGARFG